MITTIKEVIKIMTPEQGKLQDCDMWIGRTNNICHATAVMLVEDNVLYFRCKERLLRYDDSQDLVLQGGFSLTRSHTTPKRTLSLLTRLKRQRRTQTSLPKKSTQRRRRRRKLSFTTHSDSLLLFLAYSVSLITGLRER